MASSLHVIEVAGDEGGDAAPRHSVDIGRKVDDGSAWAAASLEPQRRAEGRLAPGSGKRGSRLRTGSELSDGCSGPGGPATTARGEHGTASPPEVHGARDTQERTADAAFHLAAMSTDVVAIDRGTTGMTPRQPSEERRRTAGTNEKRVGERMIAIFCLGVVLFSPLVIGIFDRGAGVGIFGVPLLYFYLFSAWTLLIVLLAFVIEGSAEVRRSARSESRHQRSDRDGGGR